MNNVKDLKSFKHLCRLCLSQSEKMPFLDSSLNKDIGLSILQVLEMIVCTKVELNNNYPSIVCTDCLKFLNAVYDFKQTFENSQIILQTVFSDYENKERLVENDTWEDDLSDNQFSNYTVESDHDLQIVKESEDIEDVEIIYINCADINEDSDLRDSKVNEKELNNSSEVVNATWIKTKMDTVKETKLLKFKSKTKYDRKQSIDVDKYIIEHTGTNPVSTDVKNMQNINDELIQAAHNLKYECSACPKLYTSQKKLEKHKEGCKKLKYINRQLENATVDQNNQLLLLYDYSELHSSMEKLDNHKATSHDYSNMDTNVNLKVRELSDIDRELFRSASLLKYQCERCKKVYSSITRLSQHKMKCDKLKKKRKLTSKKYIQERLFVEVE